MAACVTSSGLRELVADLLPSCEVTDDESTARVSVLAACLSSLVRESVAAVAGLRCCVLDDDGEDGAVVDAADVVWLRGRRL